MKFTPLLIPEVLLIERAPHIDERGFFARTFCEREFADHGIVFRPVQVNISHNTHKGTLRGMHYQAPPHGEQKVVSCPRGAIFDVAVDVRRQSPHYLQWVGAELTEANMSMLYIPAGFAHGFVTLRDSTDVSYLMGQPYVPGSASGFRYDDPAVGIRWPAVGELTISARDCALPFVPVPGGRGTV